MIAKIKSTGKLIEIYRFYNGKYQDINKFSYSEEELEFEDFKDNLERFMWVSRNPDGFVYMFEDEPEFDSDYDMFVCENECGVYLGYKEVFPDLLEGEKKPIKMRLSF